MDLTPPLTFGTRLRRYRRAAGLTQEELAERAAVSVRSIRDLERGVSRRPHRDTVALLAAALDLPAAEHPAFAEAARQVGRAGPLPTAAGEPAPPFVGRSSDLALLERHLAGGGPPLLLLAGEPGIGKTRLLRAALPRAVALGFSVLEGGCQRRGGQDPYAPLTDALQHHMRRQHPAQLRAALEGCAWLVRLLPELAEGPIPPLPSWTVSPEQEQRLMVEAVARYLANVAGAGGALLVLDDLQWAGADALEALATLTRSSAEVPLRMLGAYRDTELPASDALAVLLADLAHAGLVAQRALPPLAPREAAQLLEGLLAGVEEPRAGLRERVLQRAGGVPYFLVSCAQALRQGAATQEDAVPWDVAQSVRQRVTVLPEPAREVLGVAAVVGRVVPYALLAALVAKPEGTVLAAVEAACAGRLLVEAGETAYQFAHDVVRDVVEGDLGVARRMLLHRSVAQALEAAPGDPPLDRLAYHYGHSGEPEKAVLYLERAGDQAMARAAIDAAQSYYEELVARLDTLGRRQDAARAREKLGAALKEGGRLDAALETLGQAAATYRAADDLVRWSVVSALQGEVHALQGTFAEALEDLQPVLRALEETGVWQGVAPLSVVVAHLLGQAGRFEEQLALARRAVDLARRVGDDRLVAYALRRCGAALMIAGQAAEAITTMEEAIRLAEGMGDLPSLGWTLRGVSKVYGDRGDLDTQRRYVERAVVYAEQLDDPHLLVESAVGHGALAFHGGDWAKARREYERGLAASRRMSRTWLSLTPLIMLAQLSLAEGAWPEAVEYLAESLRTAERGGGYWMLPWAQSVAAYLDLLEGHPEQARARLVPLLAGPDLASTFFLQSLPVRVLLAWAYLDLGEVALAAELAAAVTRDARSSHGLPALVDALWMEARVALRQRCWRDAEQAAGEGLEVARRLRQPYREARLLHVVGAILLQKGEREPAQERLAAALAIFRRLGARKDMERAEGDLEKLHPKSQA